MWNKLHLGISEAEAMAKRRNDFDWEGDWKERPIAFNKIKGGAVVIASIPSNQGLDIMLGTKCEIWLFPDGTYEAEISKSWLTTPGKEKRYREAQVVREVIVDKCPKCGSRGLKKNEDGDLECICGKIIYTGLRL